MNIVVLGSAAKEATYTQFKQYVDKGYVLSVVSNKKEISEAVLIEISVKVHCAILPNIAAA